MGLLLNVGARASVMFLKEKLFSSAFQGRKKPSKGNEQCSDYRLF